MYIMSGSAACPPFSTALLLSIITDYSKEAKENPKDSPNVTEDCGIG